MEWTKSCKTTIFILMRASRAAPLTMRNSLMFYSVFNRVFRLEFEINWRLFVVLPRYQPHLLVSLLDAHILMFLCL